MKTEKRLGISAWQRYRTHSRLWDHVFDAFICAVLLIVFVVTAYPFWYILVYSLTSPLKPVIGFILYPEGFTLEAYKSLFKSQVLIHAFLISAARSTAGPITSGVVSMLVAYSLSIRELPGRRFFNWFFVMTMYFGAGLIPTYLVYKWLGMTNSFWVYIIPPMMNVYGMILMRTYIETLPVSLQESATIDGANEPTIFFMIIVPLSLPVIAAVSLFACVTQWNSYTDTVIFNTMSEKLYTLQYVLMQLVSSLAGDSSNVVNQMIKNKNVVRLTPMIIRMAVTVIAIIPIAMVYPMLQRYFIKGLLVGSIKG